MILKNIEVGVDGAIRKVDPVVSFHEKKKV